jgi:hypothetical protein
VPLIGVQFVRMVCVQYLDGQEVDVDLIFDNGVPAYGAVTVSMM